MRRLVVWGAGELGGRVARRWRGDGGPVLGATRTDARHAELRDAGLDVVAGSPLERVRIDDVLLLALPGTSLQRDAVRALAATSPPARVVLVSSTGYHAGSAGVQDESSSPGPGERAARIAECERAFAAWAGERGVVLRCGGLYRPGRGPFASIRRQITDGLFTGVVRGAADERLALVHYDDAASAAVEALRHRSPERVYVCVMPPCPTRGEFYAAVCAQIGVPAPIFAAAPSGRRPREFDVRRLRRDLLPRPAHPDWRAALRG